MKAFSTTLLNSTAVRYHNVTALRVFKPYPDRDWLQVEITMEQDHNLSSYPEDARISIKQTVELVLFNRDEAPIEVDASPFLHTKEI